MTDVNGTVVARYDYDPWGRSTTVTGTNKPDFNFTGLYNHAKSGLDMAVYRLYDPDLGRWLNRDPSGESGGLNLYGYGANNPSNLTDTAGLCPGDWWDLLEAYGIGAGEGLLLSIDGAIPFLDPLSGFYNANDPGIGFSSTVGGAALQDSRYRRSRWIILGRPKCRRYASGRRNNLSSIWWRFRALGRSWTTVAPDVVSDFRAAAGLYEGNTGEYVITARLKSLEGSSLRQSLPGPTTPSGALQLPEILFNKPPVPGISISVTGGGGW